MNHGSKKQTFFIPPVPLPNGLVVPAVVEHVVHHVTGEHVLLDISLQDEKHITQPPCKPTPMSA